LKRELQVIIYSQTYQRFVNSRFTSKTKYPRAR